MPITIAGEQVSHPHHAALVCFAAQDFESTNASPRFISQASENTIPREKKIVPEAGRKGSWTQSARPHDSHRQESKIPIAVNLQRIGNKGSKRGNREGKRNRNHPFEMGDHWKWMPLEKRHREKVFASGLRENLRSLFRHSIFQGLSPGEALLGGGLADDFGPSHFIFQFELIVLRGTCAQTGDVCVRRRSVLTEARPRSCGGHPRTFLRSYGNVLRQIWPSFWRTPLLRFQARQRSWLAFLSKRKQAEFFRPALDVSGCTSGADEVFTSCSCSSE